MIEYEKVTTQGHVLTISLSILQETWYWHENSNASNVVMSGVKCSGTELSLAHCRHDEDVACPRGGMQYGAGVACSESESLWGVVSTLPARLQEGARAPWLFLP